MHLHPACLSSVLYFGTKIREKEESRYRVGATCFRSAIKIWKKNGVAQVCLSRRTSQPRAR